MCHNISGMKNLILLLLLVLASLGYVVAQEVDLAGSYYHFSQAKIYEFRADYAKAVDEFEKAINHYSKAIEIDPTFMMPYHNRSNAYKTLGMYDKADADIIKVQELTKLLEDSIKIPVESK